MVYGGEPPEVVGGGAACADAVPERLDGDVEADLATIFETIGDRLGRVGDGHFHLLDDMPFDARRQGLARGAHDAQRYRRILGCPFLMADQQPNLMGELRGELMEAKRGQQADNAMGHGPGSFGEAMGWGAVHIGKLVEAAAYAHEKALVLEPPQSGTRDASRIKVARTRNATLFREAKEACIAGGNHRRLYMTYRKTQDAGRKDKATRRGAHQTDVLLSMVASSRSPMTSMPSALG